MKNLNHISLFTSLLAGCRKPSNPVAELQTMTCKVFSEFNDVPKIPTLDLAAWLVDPARVHPQLLDVRERDE